MLAKKTEIHEIPLKDLVLDKTVQMRLSISTSAVEDYADAMADGATFPPVIVFGRFGGKNYVADGFHRVMAAKKAGLKTVRAEIRDGSRRDAQLFAAGANATHGVRRSNEDKRNSVLALLKDREWTRWADTEIARRCAVSVSLVARLRDVAGAHREVREYVTPKGELRSVTIARDGAPEEEAAEDEDGYKSPYAFEKCPYCGRPMRHG